MQVFVLLAAAAISIPGVVASGVYTPQSTVSQPRPPTATKGAASPATDSINRHVALKQRLGQASRTPRNRITQHSWQHSTHTHSTQSASEGPPLEGAPPPPVGVVHPITHLVSKPPEWPPAPEGVPEGAPRAALEEMLAHAAMVRGNIHEPPQLGGPLRRGPSQGEALLEDVSNEAVNPFSADEEPTVVTLDELLASAAEYPLFSWLTPPTSQTEAPRGAPWQRPKEEEAPILAVLARGSLAKGPPSPERAARSGSPSDAKGNASPRLTLQQLLAETDESMGVASWAPAMAGPPSEGPHSQGKGGTQSFAQGPPRAALEEMLAQAAIARGEAEAQGAPFHIREPPGPPLRQIRSVRRFSPKEGDAPVQAVLPRGPLPKNDETEGAPSHRGSYAAAAPPQLTLQQLAETADSLGVALWGPPEEGPSEGPPTAEAGVPHVFDDGAPLTALEKRLAKATKARKLHAEGPTGGAPKKALLRGPHRGEEVLVSRLVPAAPPAAAPPAAARAATATAAAATAAAEEGAQEAVEAAWALRAAAQAAEAARAAAAAAKGIRGDP